MEKDPYTLPRRYAPNYVSVLKYLFPSLYFSLFGPQSYAPRFLFTRSPLTKIHIRIIYHYVINLDIWSFDGFWIRLAEEKEAYRYLNYTWPSVENCRRLPRHLTYMQFIGLPKGSASYYYTYIYINFFFIQFFYVLCVVGRT